MAEKVNDSIIRRIQKLLALGKGRGATEGEASNAMDMAMDLLAKYNLDMAVIQETAVAGGTVVAKEKREKSKINKSAMYGWQKDLCRVIAECNYCWHWVQEVKESYNTRQGEAFRYVKRHVILGSEVNAVAVTILYEYLVETLEEIIPYPNTERLSKAAVSWRQGCVERLIERIQHKSWEQRHNAKTEEGHQQTYGVRTQNMAQKEYEANYDSQYGEGAWAKSQEESRKYREAHKHDVATPVKEPTAAEKERDRKQSEKWHRQYQREQQKILDNRDHAAFNAGRKVGETISLADRIGEK